MTGEELRAIRQHMGLSQNRLAAVLRDAVGVGSRTTVRDWESGKANVNPEVAAFLQAVVEGREEAPEPPPLGKPGRPPSSPSDDTAPPPPSDPPRPPAQSPLFQDSAAIAKVCEQLFEMIATGVGMIGAAVGNDSLRRDGLIILDDKQALGQAWGKLAETNDTFRNMLLSADRQGAYLAVALATGTTAGKIWQNHATAQRPRVVDAAEQLRDDLGDNGAAAAG